MLEIGSSTGGSRHSRHCPKTLQSPYRPAFLARSFTRRTAIVTLRYRYRNDIIESRHVWLRCPRWIPR